MAFHFELVSPDRLILSGQVNQVTLPGYEGDFTVLEGHTALIALLRPGIVDVDTGTGVRRHFVRSGLADVSTKGLIVLAEHAIPFEELSADQITTEIQRADEEIEAAVDPGSKRLASEKRDRLRELRVALKI